MNQRTKSGIIASGLLLSLALLSMGGRPLAGPSLDGLFKDVRTEAGSAAYRRLSARFDSITDPETKAQAAFALALADLRHERHGDALRWMEQARAGGLLAGYANYYWALIAFEAGQPDAASEVIGDAAWSEGVLREKAYGLRATLLIAAGRPGDATELLFSEIEKASSAYLLLRYGLALKAAGRVAEGSAALRKVFFEFPLSGEASEANDILVEWKSDPTFTLDAPSAGQWRRRAEIFWNARSYPGAQHAYSKLAALVSGSGRSLARLRAATALYRQGKRTSGCRAAAGIGPVAGEFESERRALLARCDLRARRWDRADAHIAVLAEMSKMSKLSEQDAARQADYASTLLAGGQTAYLRGEHDLVRRYYRRYLDEFPGGRGAAAAEWKLAWLDYTEGDPVAASKLMRSLVQRESPSRYFIRALYWLGRIALEHERDAALATHLFTRLIELSPRDFLVSYARAELARLHGTPAGDATLPKWVEGIPERAGALANREPLASSLRLILERSAALLRVGLAVHADEELASALAGTEHPDLWLARAEVAAEQGDLPLSIEFARTAYPGYLHAEIDQAPRRAWELLFPLEYWDRIQSEAARRKLDPYLIAGLIRQESRFDRDAVSSAGALGLMQLMPATARGLARNRRLSSKRILTPELNIQLGVQHLAGLFRRFNGEHDKAIAAYNGGGTRVARWLRELSAHDPPAFVESIPFTQTREFVYIVSRNHNFYRDLYAGAQ